MHEYIVAFPKNVQKILEKVRLTIQKAAPDAKEAMKYQIPTFTLKGNLISFAGYDKHIGIYPAPAGDDKFRKDLAAYRSGKATVRFPLDKPIPYDLLTKIVKFRMKEHLERLAAKARKK